jgi:hypothetical protein
MKEQYIPGVCNIGKNEIRKRKYGGWTGLIITIILYSVLAYLELPRVWRFLVFVPATMAAVGFLQARMHFCAYFGLSGLFNMGAGRADTVEQAEFRAMDRKKAWSIILYSMFMGAVIAIAAYYLPL